MYDYDWIEAERRFSLALEHDPEPALICADYVFYARALGRAEDAEPRMRRVVEDDPMMVFYRLHLAFLLGASTPGSKSLSENAIALSKSMITRPSVTPSSAQPT